MAVFANLSWVFETTINKFKAKEFYNNNTDSYYFTIESF